MSTLLILSIVAVAGYVVLGAASGRARPRTVDSVTEFHRALEALDRQRRPRAPRPEAAASRSASRPAA